MKNIAKLYLPTFSALSTAAEAMISLTASSRSALVDTTDFQAELVGADKSVEDADNLNCWFLGDV